MTDFLPHVFAVSIENDLVVFDAKGDRYLALPGAVLRPQRCKPPTAGDLVEQASTLLGQAGLLSAGAAAGTRSGLPRPARRHAPQAIDRGRAGPRDLLRFAWAMTVSAARMRQGIGCASFAGCRTRREQVDHGLDGALARLRAARLLVPSPRRCLPASLTAARFLRGLGHEVDIVFGVRSHPFAAHCWLERNGMVLDDDIDRVRAFTPIAVGRL